MKLRRIRRAMLLPLFAAVAGCGIKQTDTADILPLVEKIISAPQSAEYQVLGAVDPGSPKGSLTILDSPGRCAGLSEYMMCVDAFDNVDGVPAPDGLPDFAGETITSILDIVYTPYGRFISAGNVDALREVAVRASLAAIDTSACLGPFDHESRSRKERAKLLILSSPYMAAHGLSDIDTLFSVTGAEVPVVCPAEAMVEQLFASRAGTLNVGVMTDTATAESGVHQLVFSNVASRHGDASSVCITLPVPVSGSEEDWAPDILGAWLEAYAASGRTIPLTALLVDDMSVSAEDLRASLSRIQSLPEEEYVFLRKFLAKDFEIIDSRETAVRECYHILRERNLFTHNIAYPHAASYITSPEAGKYELMDFSQTDLPDSLLLEMEVSAPKTTKSYVQNQHFSGGN